MSSTKRSRKDPRKQRTRRALLDASLELVEKENSFASISIREVAKRVGIVPTAFYRHFKNMDELGLELVDEALRTLRQMMREARTAPLPAGHLIRRSIKTYVAYVQEHRLYFHFMLRERMGGNRALRVAIRQGIQGFINELATDLSHFPALSRYRTGDLQLLSATIVNTVMTSTELLLDLPPDDKEEEKIIRRMAEKQLIIIFLGAAQWQPDRDKD